MKVCGLTFGKNDKGDITINGRPLMKYRLLKAEHIDLFLQHDTLIKILKEASSVNEINDNVPNKTLKQQLQQIAPGS